MTHPDHVSRPVCEIITIGTELLLGQIVDTNTAYLAQRLAHTGVRVRFKTCVGDHLEEIQSALQNALARSDMVVATGGLGPTLDDLTREAVSRVAGVPLEFREALMAEIAAMFRRYGYDMPENNRRQAFVPAGSRAVSNPVGTAPAFITEVGGKPVICLPGVPKELKYLMTHEVLPWVRDRFALVRKAVSTRVLKVVGIGESHVDRQIGDLIKPGENPEVGLLASQGEIKIRIAAVAEGERSASELMAPLVQEIRSRLKTKIFGEDTDTLEGIIGDLLSKMGLTVAVLETFSGGLTAERLFHLSEPILRQSMVIPEADRMAAWAGASQMAVTEPTGLSLAEQVRLRAGTEVGLSILGFPEKQDTQYVLHACSAAKGPGISKTFSWKMGGDLETLRIRGAVIGLNTLRLALLAR